MHRSNQRRAWLALDERAVRVLHQRVVAAQAFASLRDAHTRHK
jgi:hypothetical protein